VWLHASLQDPWYEARVQYYKRLWVVEVAAATVALYTRKAGTILHAASVGTMGAGASAVVMTREQVKTMLQDAISAYTPKGDYESFRQLANGFFQLFLILTLDLEWL
jgi:hypothetical protein